MSWLILKRIPSVLVNEPVWTKGPVMRFPCHEAIMKVHDDVIKWKYFPCYWPFVRGIHRPPANSPHKGQWRGALMFSVICAQIYGWVNNRKSGDLRRHYDVTVMQWELTTDICACHISTRGHMGWSRFNTGRDIKIGVWNSAFLVFRGHHASEKYTMGIKILRLVTATLGRIYIYICIFSICVRTSVCVCEHTSAYIYICLWNIYNDPGMS